MLTCGNRSSFADLVYLISGPVGRLPRTCRFWVDELVVPFVEVFVLFAFAFAGVVVVVSDCWFFFSAACVFDFGEDDLALGDTPAEFISFLPVERFEDVVRDFDVVVFRVGILFNLSDELT